MPELPEVETIRRIIAPQLVGKTIETVEIDNAQVIAYPVVNIFAEGLKCQTITGMSRRGKFLNIHFKSGDCLSIHLRMTGQLLVMTKNEPIEKHTHLVLSLSDGCQLRYVDVRRFGRFWYFKVHEKDTLSGQTKLGLEPIDPALSAEYLKSQLGKRKRSIKEMLLDQSVVAGIGNIYSDEILFAAAIYPGTPCDILKDSDWCRLAERIPEIILWAIDVNDMTAEEYLRGKGKKYRNTPYLKIYARSGQHCVYCQTIIEKITIGGRSSCYCPKCQGGNVDYH